MTLPFLRSLPVLSLILKLFALRPLLSFAIFGIPVLTIIAIGLFTIVAVKVLVFVVLPLTLLTLLIVWLVRRFRRPTVTA